MAKLQYFDNKQIAIINESVSLPSQLVTGNHRLPLHNTEEFADGYLFRAISGFTIRIMMVKLKTTILPICPVKLGSGDFEAEMRIIRDAVRDYLANPVYVLASTV